MLEKKLSDLENTITELTNKNAHLQGNLDNLQGTFATMESNLQKFTTSYEQGFSVLKKKFENHNHIIRFLQTGIIGTTLAGTSGPVSLITTNGSLVNIQTSKPEE